MCEIYAAGYWESNNYECESLEQLGKEREIGGYASLPGRQR